MVPVVLPALAGAAAEVLADYRRGDVQMLGFVIAAIANALDGVADALEERELE